MIKKDDPLLALFEYEDSSIGLVLLVIITRVILSVFVICADLFLICTICRFKRLRVRSNVYIWNCCILNICYIISSPVFFLLELIYIDSCFHLRIINSFLVLYVVFASLLALDWFLLGCRPKIMQIYNKIYKFVFPCLYILIFVDALVPLAVCYGTEADTRYYIFNVVYVISLTIVVIVNILSKIINLNSSSYKTAYSITTSNIMIFSYLPLLLYHFVSFYFYDINKDRQYVAMNAEFFPLIVALAHPVLVVYMLGNQNKYFKMAYKKSFNKKSVQHYADENLDDISDAENDAGDYCLGGNRLTERA